MCVSSQYAQSRFCRELEAGSAGQRRTHVFYLFRVDAGK
jgi:hypothetical protein